MVAVNNYNYKDIEDKWQRRWHESRIFDAETGGVGVGDRDKKFFITVPYPYTSGPLHIGHGRTYTIGDIIARFKRLEGYNVLFPMAFHVTGTPILAIADSIAKGDAEVVARYRDYVSIYEREEQVDEIVNSFSDAEAVAKFFADRIAEDFKRMGYSIDWRRKFNTTEPMYNWFVEWQFKKLNDKGVIKKGKYPITFSIEDGSPVGEDDIEGGDTDKVSIIEHTTIKFKLPDGSFLVASTLRPETIFGVTNLWINPDVRYVKVRVEVRAEKGEGDKDEHEFWIVSKEAAEKLSYQKSGIEILEEIEGGYFVGKEVEEPVEGREVPVLPASFVDPDVGTGVVYSVPAHAPYDYIALEDLKRKREELESGSGIEIEPIKIIEIVGSDYEYEYELPAKDICVRMGIESQEDPRLEEATQQIYKEEFYRGVLNDRCGKFAGIKIAEIKDEVKDWLRERNVAGIFYETSRKAVTRSGDKVIVAVLHDQWFIDYRAEWWKELGHKLVSKMTFYPDRYKAYMHDIIDWLALRPCARKRGLGTRFPFDRAWIIESLSDSTIYMALYTIAHLLRALPVESLTESFFDYVFLGVGDAAAVANEIGIDAEVLDKIRAEFEYWYPNDLRHTAPPHLSNHLAFFLMHHAAIFPPNKWPGAITLNELMIREGRKMSKSKGNVIPLAKVSELYGVDLYRLYCAINADFGAVVNWREQDVDALRRKFNALIELFEDSIGAGVEGLKEDEFTHIDRWLLARFYRRLRDSIEQYRAFRIREAGINMFFEMMNDIKYYEQRASVARRKRIVRNVMDAWLIILSPITPHICEEIWHKLHENKDKTFISVERLPEIREKFIDERVEREEEYLTSLVNDIKEILHVARLKPGKIYVYTAEKWKWDVLRAIKDVEDKDKIREAMKFRKDKTTAEFVKRAMKILPLKKKASSKEGTSSYFELDEEAVLEREKEYLMHEFGCEIEINGDYDPENKRRLALPLKPAIYVDDKDARR